MNQQQSSQPISGVLLVDKPQDWTSHDVVACVRGRFRIKKVGHCGTLDPMATGLLIIVVGRGTKLSQQLMGHSKTYTGTILLGTETDSQDAMGKTTKINDYKNVTEEQIRQIVKTFIGQQKQIPPMVSAVKKGGKKLYELARQGKTIEREPREITIHTLEILSINIPEIQIRVHCSKGTYIRTLAADIGEKLGCGGHLKELRREKSGFFDVADAYTMETIKSWEKEDLQPAVILYENVLEILEHETE